MRGALSRLFGPAWRALREVDGSGVVLAQELVVRLLPSFLCIFGISMLFNRLGLGGWLGAGLGVWLGNKLDDWLDAVLDRAKPIAELRIEMAMQEQVYKSS